jgi:excisionase family DNA binding protein
MTLKELPPTVTVEQAGQMLGISRRSAYRAAARGDLPTLRLGRRLIVPTARLLELLGMSSNAIGNVLPSQSD